MPFNFVYDPGKAKSHQRKHGVTFREAATIWEDANAMVLFDAEHSEAEDRWIRLGMSARERLLVVVSFETEQGEGSIVRLISARVASVQESSEYLGRLKR